MYMYPYCCGNNYNDGYGSNWIWIIIVVAVIFLIFCNNGFTNNNNNWHN